MTQKTLVGVLHNSQEELEAVIAGIEEQSATKVGIELSEDYLEREKVGIRIAYLNDIAEYLRESGIEVIPLEHPDLYNYAQAIQIVKAVRDGRLHQSQVEVQLIQLNVENQNPFASSEQNSRNYLFRDRYQKVLDILAETPTLDGVMELWLESNSKREEYVLNKILTTSPDFVVMGYGHAVAIKNKLPSFLYVPMNV